MIWGVEYNLQWRHVRNTLVSGTFRKKLTNPKDLFSVDFQCIQLKNHCNIAFRRIEAANGVF